MASAACVRYIVVNSTEEENERKIELKKPTRIICYMCGRKNGRQSIRFHHEKCIRRRIGAGEPLLVPPAPVLEDKIPTEAGEALNAYNKLAQEVFERHAYTQCQWCSRHLLRTDRALRAHARECPGLVVPGSRRDTLSNCSHTRKIASAR